MLSSMRYPPWNCADRYEGPTITARTLYQRLSPSVDLSPAVYQAAGARSRRR